MYLADIDLEPQLLWHTFRDTAIGRYLLQDEQAFIHHAIQLMEQPPHSLLEIACNTGRMTTPLRTAGQQMVGLDIDPTVLPMFRRYSPTTPLTRGDALDLPFADSSFDCIVAIQCFSSFEPAIFFKECQRVLAPGGLLILQAVNRRNYKRLLKRLRGQKATTRPNDNLSSEEVLRALTEHNFTIEFVRGYNWMPIEPVHTRFSNSPLIGPVALLEKLFRLDRLYTLSPWILVAASKRAIGVERNHRYAD